MNNLLWGVIFGLVLGTIDVIVMIPMKESDKRKKNEAMLGAFIERFMIGLLIPNVDFGVGYPITGLILGLTLSVPTAIITRVYAPIIGIGAIGGLVVGVACNYLIG